VQIVKYVSFAGACTGKYVVKSVKEACETVHSTIKETCQHATQFDRLGPCKTACFWWVKEIPKDAQECDLRLCKFVGYFHVFPSSYVRRRKIGQANSREKALSRKWDKESKSPNRSTRHWSFALKIVRVEVQASGASLRI